MPSPAVRATAVDRVGLLVLGKFEAVRTHAALVERTEDASGRPTAVYVESVVRTRPDDLTSPLEGRGRFHTELFILNRLGMDVASLSPSYRNAARFIFDGIFPFVLLIVISLFTWPPPT